MLDKGGCATVILLLLLLFCVNQCVAGYGCLFITRYLSLNVVCISMGWVVRAWCRIISVPFRSQSFVQCSRIPPSQYAHAKIAHNHLPHWHNGMKAEWKRERVRVSVCVAPHLICWVHSCKIGKCNSNNQTLIRIYLLLIHLQIEMYVI